MKKKSTEKICILKFSS